MWTVVAPDRVRGAGRVEVSDAPHFFPPRLEVVALQQHPDRFPPHVWNDPAFDRFLREQADRPPRRADRRIGARHGEDALLVGGREDFRCHGTRPLIERRLEAVGAVALGDDAHRLRDSWTAVATLGALSRDPMPTRRAPARPRGQAAPHPAAGHPACAGWPAPSETTGEVQTSPSLRQCRSSFPSCLPTLHAVKDLAERDTGAPILQRSAFRGGGPRRRLARLNGAYQSESPRDSRRLHFVREWSHAKAKPVSPRGA